jgi:hypothetical protein
LIEFILPFAYSIAGSAGTRTNIRAIFEQTLSSRAATDRESTARLERGLASSAAGGASVPRKFAPGELQKKRRHVDAQERMDELVGGMVNEAGLMADAIKSITAVNAESPGRKKQRQLTSITANIKLLYEEKKMIVDLGMETEDVDEQIRKLVNERKNL